MKKILKWVFPAFLGIVPAMGADSSAAADQAFLNHEKGTYTITRIRESEVDGKLKMTATIKATIPDLGGEVTRSIPVGPLGGFTPAGWVHDDGNLVSRRKGRVFFDLSDDREITKEYTRSDGTPYTLVSSKKGVSSNADLPLGKAVDMGDTMEYKRPDGTQYFTNQMLGQAIALILYNEQPMKPEEFVKEPVGTKAQVAKFAYSNGVPGDMIEVLYPVILAQILEPSYAYEYCYLHGLEEQRGWKKLGQMEMRHAYKTFSATPITLIINTDTPGMPSKTVYTGQRRVQLKLQSQQYIGVGQKNCGSCTANNYENGGLPPHHYIVP